MSFIKRMDDDGGMCSSMDDGDIYGAGEIVNPNFWPEGKLQISVKHNDFDFATF